MITVSADLPYAQPGLLQFALDSDVDGCLAGTGPFKEGQCPLYWFGLRKNYISGTKLGSPVRAWKWNDGQTSGTEDGNTPADNVRFPETCTRPSVWKCGVWGWLDNPDDGNSNVDPYTGPTSDPGTIFFPK